MSYKLTFSLTNVTLGDLADFIEAAQELGAPDSAVLQFEGDQVIVEVGESTSSSSARSARSRFLSSSPVYGCAM